MNIQILISFEAIDEETCQVIGGERAAQIAAEVEAIIRDRLVGEGFLPADLTLGQFEICSEIVEPAKPAPVAETT